MVKVAGIIKEFWIVMKMFRFFKSHLYVYPRLVKAVLLKIFFKKAFLRNVVIELTTKCNARCGFCYAEPSWVTKKEDNNTLNEDDVYRIIDWASKNNVATVTLSGGETLLVKQLAKYVKACCDKKLIPVVGTNGVLLKPEKLDELKAAGLSIITCSVHGVGDMHSDILKIKGSYEKIISNLKYAISQNMICFFNHVMTKESIKNGSTKEVLTTLMGMGFAGANLLPECASGTDMSVLLDEEELRLYRNYLENPKIRADIKNYFGDYHCPAAWEDIFISNKGDVTPCPFLPIKYGNVKKDAISDVVSKMRSDERFLPQAPMCLAAENKPWAEKHLKHVYEGGDIPLAVEKLDELVAAANQNKPSKVAKVTKDAKDAKVAEMA